jgi:hypothetical protein
MHIGGPGAAFRPKAWPIPAQGTALGLSVKWR